MVRRKLDLAAEIDRLVRELAMAATPGIEEMEFGRAYCRAQELPEGVLASLSDEVQEGFRKSECLAFRTGDPFDPLRVIQVVGVNVGRI